MLKRVLLIWQTLLSHYKQHPAQGVFLLIGLSLGVAILLGTLIVSDAAKNSFMAGQKVIGGQVYATIHPLDSNNTLPQSLYVSLRQQGFTQLMPMIEGRVRLKDGRSISIQGIDVFALLQSSAEEQQLTTGSGVGLSLVDFSFEPYQTLMIKTVADRLGIDDGDTLTLADGRSLPSTKVVSNELGIGYKIVCDIRCAQELLSLPHQLTSISLTAAPVQHLGSLNSDTIERLKSLLPEGITLTFPRQDLDNQALSDAFFLNITAVSFLAFLVGCFIAFNAVRFSVLQRLSMVKQLRLTGVTFSEVALALLLELLFWALLASIVGCLLGWLLADLLLPGVSLTLAQLFQGKNVLSLDALHHWWLLALSISLIATFTATVHPFWRLAQQQPLQQNQNISSHSPRFFQGLGLLLFGGVLSQFGESQLSGFIISACWFVGGALLVPGILQASYQQLSGIKGLVNYPKLHWAVTDGQFNYARLSVAMMAFSVAIAAGIAITTMVGSFRITLVDYLDQTLSESLYILPDSPDSAKIRQYLHQHSGVALAYRYLHTTTTLAQQGDEIHSTVRSLSNDKVRHASLGLEKQVDDVWQKLHNRQGILINQTLAMQQQLNPGDKITIETTGQSIQTKVLGVYFSYGSTAAATTLDQGWFERLWPLVDSPEIGVYLDDPATTDDLINALQQQFALQSHQYFKPDEMKKRALEIFEQTFQATHLLTLFTLLIAAIGIYCACYASEIDKQRQLTLLKVLGVNNREIAGLSLLQLGFNAMVACLVALPLGLLIAWASVHIVLQYFLQRFLF